MITIDIKTLREIQNCARNRFFEIHDREKYSSSRDLQHVLVLQGLKDYLELKGLKPMFELDRTLEDTKWRNK